MRHKGAGEVSSTTCEAIGKPQRAHHGPAMPPSEARQARQIGTRLALSRISSQIRQDAGNITEASASAKPLKPAPITCREGCVEECVERLTAPQRSPFARRGAQHVFSSELMRYLKRRLRSCRRSTWPLEEVYQPARAARCGYRTPCSCFSWHTVQWLAQGTASRRFCCNSVSQCSQTP